MTINLEEDQSSTFSHDKSKVGFMNCVIYGAGILAIRLALNRLHSTRELQLKVRNNVRILTWDEFFTFTSDKLHKILLSLQHKIKNYLLRVVVIDLNIIGGLVYVVITISFHFLDITIIWLTCFIRQYFWKFWVKHWLFSKLPPAVTFSYFLHWFGCFFITYLYYRCQLLLKFTLERQSIKILICLSKMTFLKEYLDIYNKLIRQQLSNDL